MNERKDKKEGTTTITAYSYDKAGNKSPAGTIAVKKQSNITISYNANGGTGAPSTQTGNVFNNTTSMNFTIPSTVPTKKGYTFLRWSSSSTETTATYVKGKRYSFSDNITLYAVWEKAVPKVAVNTKAEENSTINGKKGTAQNPVVPK